LEVGAEKRWKRNGVKHKQTEHDKSNSWDGKLTDGSGVEKRWKRNRVKHTQKERNKKTAGTRS
jgi:hypothetical protein